MIKQEKSPYLKNPDRLLKVIAAIQAMAVNKYYKLECKDWAEKISANEGAENEWLTVFKEHPEFFRISDNSRNISLILRRNMQRTYYYDKRQELTREEVNQLTKEEQDNELSRRPLDKDEMAILINTAIDMHSKAMAERQDQRWWYTPIIGIAGTLIGVVLGVLIQ